MIIIVFIFILLLLFVFKTITMMFIVGLTAIGICIAVTLIGKIYEFKTGIASSCMFRDKNSILDCEILNRNKYQRWMKGR